MMRFLPTGLLAVFIALASVTPVEARQVIFALDAVATEISGDSSLLPATFAVGSTIEGEYSVDREDLLTGHVFEKRFGTAAFHVEGIEMLAAPVSYRRIDILGDDSLPNPNNTLRFEGLAIETPFGDPNDFLVARTTLRMVGEDGSLTRIDQLLDEEVWEELDAFRMLELAFFRPGEATDGAPSATVQAVVRRVVVVPEPCGAALAALCLAATYGNRATRRDYSMSFTSILVS